MSNVFIYSSFNPYVRFRGHWAAGTYSGHSWAKAVASHLNMSNQRLEKMYLNVSYERLLINVQLSVVYTTLDQLSRT